MNRSAGPFGPYAFAVAAGLAGAIAAAWLAATAGVIPSSPTLDAAFWTVVGATIGTGAGAGAVANGIGRAVDANAVRLDAIGAPPAHVAHEAVEHGQLVPPASVNGSPPNG